MMRKEVCAISCGENTVFFFFFFLEYKTVITNIKIQEEIKILFVHDVNIRIEVCCACSL